MSSISRPRAAGTTAHSAPREAGSRAKPPEKRPETDWSSSIRLRDEVRYQLWLLGAKVRHAFGRHSWIPNEVWDRTDHGIVIRFQGHICWLCPATK